MYFTMFLNKDDDDDDGLCCFHLPVPSSVSPKYQDAVSVWFGALGTNMAAVE